MSTLTETDTHSGNGLCVGLGQCERIIRTCSDWRSSRFVRDKSGAGGMDSSSAIVPRRSECVMLLEPVKQTALPLLFHGCWNAWCSRSRWNRQLFRYCSTDVGMCDAPGAGETDSSSAIVPRMLECVMLLEPVEWTAFPPLCHGGRPIKLGDIVLHSSVFVQVNMHSTITKTVEIHVSSE